MKKILAIVLMMALMAVLACSAFASGEPSAAPAAGAAEAADAAPTPVFEWRVITAPTATEDGLRGLYGTSDDVLYLTDVIPALGADDNFAAWKDYVKAYALAGAPNEEEGQTVAGLIDAAASVEEVEAIAQLTVLFESVGVLGYDAWIAAGMPAADVEGMGSEADNQASGEAASAEPAGEGD